MISNLKNVILKARASLHPLRHSDTGRFRVHSAIVVLSFETRKLPLSLWNTAIQANPRARANSAIAQGTLNEEIPLTSKTLVTKNSIPSDHRHVRRTRKENTERQVRQRLKIYRTYQKLEQQRRNQDTPWIDNRYLSQRWNSLAVENFCSKWKFLKSTSLLVDYSLSATLIHRYRDWSI